MNFKLFNQQIQAQFATMCETGMLFRADVSGNDLWELYLSSFENETIFRDPESSEHNCNCCKNFIRRYGNVVAINADGNLISLFTNIIDVEEYSNSVIALNDIIINANIKDVFFETYDALNRLLNYESCTKTQKEYKLGIESNFKQYTQEEVDKFGVVNTEKIYEFNHFCILLPKQFVDFSGNSIERIAAFYKDKYLVFKRAMEEIPVDTLNLVKDLIHQGSLLDGTAHLHAVDAMIDLKQIHEKCEDSEIVDNWYWKVTYSMEERIAKFKNTLIGVLCTELAEGEELNKACQNWNKRVDPINYHKATAPITQKQIDAAKVFVEENGYAESFNRRLANIDDIKASEILHLNAGDGKIEEVSMFDSVKSTSTQHKRSQFDNVEEVPIQKFMEDILPSCSSIEILLKNKHEGNLVTMTTSKKKNSKRITKWNKSASNYSWTFNGNLAGKSQIKEAVKAAGGDVEGVLNFRLAWNDSDGTDNSDLDAWAKEPGNTKIGYNTNFRKDQGNNRTAMSGQLDVDNTNPSGKLAVENITWINKNAMRDGVYKLWVNQYAARNSQGFKAEIEVDGEIYSYEYNQPIRGNIEVAEVTLKEGQFTIKHLLKETNQSRQLWGLETNKFHRVNLVCKSPNHWGENSVGNLHYFFMLEKCIMESNVRSFHNENLIPELLKHKKVLEVLGATNMIKPTKKQLSGIGFNSTVRDNIIVKCSGNFKRVINIKF
jgi:hypothetical protein